MKLKRLLFVPSIVRVLVAGGCCFAILSVCALAATDDEPAAPPQNDAAKKDTAKKDATKKDGAKRDAPKRELPPVAAMFDGDPVYVGEVDSVLIDLQKARQVNSQSVVQAKADVLRLILKRRAAERVLRREGFVKDTEIDREIDKMRTQAGMQRTTVDQHLAKRRITYDTLRHEIAWKLGWDRYLESKLGEALEAYFNKHRKELDGTQLRASHILLRSERVSQSIPQLMAQATQIRQDIEAGKITFEKAAEKYSAGPSRLQQGDLGFFPRYGVMADEFGKAAFALEKDEISQPVATSFGVHLIKVTDEKPGSKRWTEAANQLKGPATLDLFDAICKDEMDKANIEYSGKTPFYKPGTNQVVVPGAPAVP